MGSSRRGVNGLRAMARAPDNGLVRRRRGTLSLDEVYRRLRAARGPAGWWPARSAFTADSIALYAAGLPLFVIDAYTRRVFSRLGLVRGDEPYDVLQRVFMEALPAEAALYNDYHAQVVILAKDVCRARPACGVCPLGEVCPRTGIPAEADQDEEVGTTVGWAG